MAIGPVQEVPAPVGGEARRYSILDSAVGPLELPGDRPSDIAYKQMSCGDVSVYSFECESTPDTPGFPGLVTGTAFDVEVSLECRAVGLSAAEVRTQIERGFAAREHIGVETFLVDAIMNDDDLVDLGNMPSVPAAVPELEHFIYGTSAYGLAAHILAPFAQASAFAWTAQFAGQSKRDPAWKMPIDTRVTFVSGLPQNTLLVTGQIILWRQPSVWIPPEEAALLDRELNVWKGRGRRGYVAAYECATAKITIGGE